MRINVRGRIHKVSDLDFHFTAELWLYTTEGAGAWHFVTVPIDVANQISFFRQKHHGFGTIRVTARINDTDWKTSLFPDKASDSFLLPIKKDVRQKEHLSVGETVSVSLFMDL